MTKQHFEEIARTIGRSILPPESKLVIADDLAKVFAEENPRFNRRIFLETVMYEDGLSQYEGKKNA